MAFHKADTSHNTIRSRITVYIVVTEYCFSSFLPRDSKNFTQRFKSLSNLQMFKIWSRHVTAICWHQSHTHWAEALFFSLSFTLR